MIKTGDLVGWSDHFHRERPDLNELDDFGVVVSVFKKKQNFGFPEIDTFSNTTLDRNEPWSFQNS